MRRALLVAIASISFGCAEPDTRDPSGGSPSTGTGFGGGPARPHCGDGKIDADEECDGDDFGDATCADYDRPNGSLGCNSYCLITHTGCFREEKCDSVVGVDRDGDGLFGCADDDCFDHPWCATPCEVNAFVSVLDASPEGGWSILHLPSGHGAEPDAMSASCAAEVTGGDRIYGITPAVTGTLRIEADTTLDGMDLSLSLRTACAEVSSEVACEHVPGAAEPETLSAHVEAGTDYYLIVDGFLPNTIPSMMLWMGLDPDETGGGGAGGGIGGNGIGGAGGTGGGS
ncbi:MAG: hypothetical protein JNK04_00135 [Myxococcales bacterium]|nr:hypothetical protein [Myxococcales bacterium]